MASMSESILTVMALYNEQREKNPCFKKDLCEVRIRFKDGYVEEKGKFSDFLHIVVDLLAGNMKRDLENIVIRISGSQEFFRICGSNVSHYSCCASHCTP